MTNFWSTLPKPILALAPMEGVTDSAFRQICREFGADVVYTEFISSDAIDHQARSALQKMDFRPNEQPVVCQIFGRNPDAFRRAAEEVQRRGFSGIDINFGCPARKVMSHGSGVALMRNPEYARTLIESVLATVDLPVSIKVRASIRREAREIDPQCSDRVTAVDLVNAIRDLPVAAIMVHGRSFEQGFSGEADIETIRQVKRLFHGVVLGNGGIHSPADATRMIETTGADGVGIARGSLGQPWIFQEVAAALKRNSTPTALPDVRQIIIRHAELLIETKGERALTQLRKHLAAYVRGHRHAHAFRRRLSAVTTLREIEMFANDLSDQMQTAPPGAGGAAEAES